MKKTSISLWNRYQALRRKRGMALISLLAIIVLLTALVVGFLVRAGSERISAANYHATASTRLLADTAVNLVQAQINEATSQGTDKAWASQPGAIRVFDNTGTMTKFYRLYSAPTLTSSGGSPLSLINADVPPVNWSKSPALWVDLNRPIVVSGATSSTNAKDDYSIFPILDPRDPTDTSTTATKPGVTSKIPGFSITNAPDATDAQPAPMPTQWLYVLQSGAIVTPTGTGQTTVNVPGSGADPIVGRIAFWTDDESSKVNINTAAGSLSYRPTPQGAGAPLPGDTLKAMPAPWQPPRFRDWDDYRLYAQNQPVPREYQRFPGHPATTDLYPILHQLGMKFVDYPYPAADFTSGGLTAVANGTMSSFFDLLPRYADAGGSKAGTANTTSVTPPIPAEGKDGTVARSPKFDRLYSSLGELFYSAKLTGSDGRVSNGLSRQMLESGKFFLTTSSRAPDVTLFGTPRISLWPISSKYGTDSPGPVSANTTGLNYASPYDQAIAFCTSLRSDNASKPFNQYYFQRFDATSTSWDFDRGNIPRNPVLYQFLQNLTGTEIPGFGGNFKQKYDGEAPDARDQILTEMVDYIRCTNLYDYAFTDTPTSATFKRFTKSDSNYGQAVPIRIGNTQGLGRAATISEIGIVLICVADGNGLDPATAGSANDWRTASNLPAYMQLKNAAGTLVNPDGGTDPAKPQFPLNPALSTTYNNNGVNPATGPKHRAALSAGQKRLQAMVVYEPFSPMLGYCNINLDFNVKIKGLESFQLAGQNPFPAPSSGSYFSTISPTVRANGTNQYGGLYPFQFGMSTWNGTAPEKNTRLDGWITNNRDTELNYPFISNPFTVSGVSAAGQGQIRMGGSFTLELYARKRGSGGLYPSGYYLSNWQPTPYQTFNITFPPVDVPVPDLLQYGICQSGPVDSYIVVAGISTLTTNNVAPNEMWNFDKRLKHIDTAGSIGYNINSTYTDPGSVIRADPPSVALGTPVSNWTMDRTKANAYPPGCVGPASPPAPKNPQPVAPRYKNPIATDYHGTEVSASQSVPSDTTRTMVTKEGDVRLTMAKAVVDVSATGDLATAPGYYASGYKLVNSFQSITGNASIPGCDLGGKLVADANYGPSYVPKVPSNVAPRANWDWDSGIIGVLDGAYANKPDEGNVYVNGNTTPYYNGESESVDSQPSYFTPNRIIPSGVMFGSLPTGVKSGVSWRTLLFRPMANHDTLGGPKDHLLLDLFTMPVIEPYAISEPLSTAGRVNMNYQIVPFTYIKRSSAVRAVLDSELITRVPKVTATVMNASSNYSNVYYKSNNGSFPTPTATTGGGTKTIAQLPINLDEQTGTLKQFEDKFAGGDIFKSASEICDLYLVPDGYSWPTFASDWYGDDFALVGDNVRERPYADIYPRLTTKSNTFTVHYTVQALKNPNPTGSSEWNEARGAIVGEYRGSTTIERFVDPNNKNIPDYATTFPNPTAYPLDKFYQWRIVANNQFAP